MKQSIFRKEVSATGPYGTVKAEIVAMINYKTKNITGTNAFTHDNFEKTIPVHKVQVVIHDSIWKEELELTTELELYNRSRDLIKLAKERVDYLANNEPEKTFGDKMIELFS